MDDSSADPPLPQQSSTPSAASTGCVILCAVASIPILYVGSFVYLLADSLNQWGFCDSLDEGTLAALEIIYWPLLWLYFQLVGGFGP